MENESNSTSPTIPLPPPPPTSTPNVSSGGPPPPPPPLPGTKGALKIPTYKETKQQKDVVDSMEKTQYANLPDKLINTMRREKKPFTYTPLSVGDNGKLDLSQIKSPRMKKRLIANMKDENEEKDENKIESIDTSLQNNRNSDDLDFKNNLDTLQYKSQSQPQTPQMQQPQQSKYYPQTKSNNQPFVVPLSVLQDDNSSTTCQRPTPPRRQISLNYNLTSPEDKLDQYLTDNLNRTNLIPDLNNNYNSSFQNTLIQNSPQVFGLSKPRKINIAQEINHEKNFNTTPSRPFSQNNYNSTPKSWSPAQTKNAYSNSEFIEPICAQNSSKLNNSIYDLNTQTYIIPIQKSSPPPTPPQRQQSLNKTNVNKQDRHIIPIQVEHEEPIQSKSFKILQKLTQGIEEEIEKLDLTHNISKKTVKNDIDDIFPPYHGTLNHIEAPRVRREHQIPIRVENNNSAPISEYYSQAEQNWFTNNYNDYSTLQPISNSLQNEFFSKTPASQQKQIQPPPRYQGANIPSRSFRILQMLTGEDVVYY